MQLIKIEKKIIMWIGKDNRHIDNRVICIKYFQEDVPNLMEEVDRCLRIP